MTDDTRTDTAATRATDNAPSTDPKRTPAALLGRAIQARFAAVARQAVALGLIRAGAQEFTHITTADYCHGFPEGSDYGALFPQDDLSPTQAEEIFREANDAVQVEAEKMIDEAEGDDLAVALIDQLSEWEEGAALEWAHLVQLREQADRDDAEFDRKQEQKQQAAELASGARYVATYLLSGNNLDLSWIAESLDDGRLVACPRCHFLYLPVNPFARRAWEIKRHGPPLDACDVCAALPVSCEPINWGEGWADALPRAEDDLADERTARAVTLYDLWIGATNGADALRVAAIAEGLEGLRTLTRTPGVAEG